MSTCPPGLAEVVKSLPQLGRGRGVIPAAHKACWLPLALGLPAAGTAVSLDIPSEASKGSRPVHVDGGEHAVGLFHYHGFVDSRITYAAAEDVVFDSLTWPLRPTRLLGPALFLRLPPLAIITSTWRLPATFYVGQPERWCQLIPLSLLSTPLVMEGRISQPRARRLEPPSSYSIPSSSGAGREEPYLAAR